MQNTFFMVYLDGSGGPTYKHGLLESAVEEAKRLSRIHKRKAYVMVAYKSYELIEFKEETLVNPDPDNDLPF